MGGARLRRRPPVGPARRTRRFLIRRAEHVAIRWRRIDVPDVVALLHGIARTQSRDEPLALSLLTGTERVLSDAELAVLLELPVSHWTREEDVTGPREVVDALVRDGYLVSDREEHRALRNRDDALSTSGWHPHAAFHHFGTRWGDVGLDHVDVDVEALDWALGEIAAAPPPLDRAAPNEFHELPGGRALLDLPQPELVGELYEVLLARKTTRAFDPQRPITLDQLSLVLAAAFGCHGTARLHEGVVALRRTSPSGGGLHPIEVYPLVLRVAGLEAGLYHYRSRDHVLELVEAPGQDEAARLASEFTAGQVYFARAGALFLLTARFARTYWKYRRHDKAYAVVLMDAAHLSQTLQLVCTELGLGAFVTAAINDLRIEERLGVDGIDEGAVLVCGCGVPSSGPTNLEEQFEPYGPIRRREGPPASTPASDQPK